VPPAVAPAASGVPARSAEAGVTTPYTPRHLAEKILRLRAALEGERRQVTVLFADVAGFTALAERLDPEEVHRMMNRCFELISAEVHRFEGTINQYTGDGVMALFGAPIAHEDGPRRAVHAALGIQRALREGARQLEAARGLSLQMRIGINTGPVVVGRIGDDLRMDYTAVGDTTNLAARMQQIARPGSVFVAEPTFHAIEGFFETLELGEVAVKGHSPVRAWEVVRPRTTRSRLDVAAEHGLTAFVGRERELSTLLDRFAQVKAGRGQLVLLLGEAGIGKSRLLREFRQALARSGENLTWLEGQCVSFGRSIPFLPLVDQLRRNFDIEEFDGEPEIIAKVEHGLRRMGGLEPHIPYVRYLLSVEPGDPAIIAMDPESRRRKVFEAIRALTARGASLRPLVLVFEDLHWVDSSTEEYLAGSVDSVAGGAVMLILTARLGYVPSFGSRSFQTTLTLQSLSPAETVAMASRVLGTDEFPEPVKGALMEKAEGVPLFIEEVAKTLVDLGVLRRDASGLRMVKGLADVSVPDTIQGIIMARLDRLGDEGKRAVQLASVIGRRFLMRLLDRVAGMAGRLEGLLAELKALEIIYEQGLLPEPAYIFKHAVIQDVAYNSLLKERQRELHRAVGAAIEDLYADRLPEHYEELAHHFVIGEEWSKAFDYLIRSGDRARDAYANQVALDFYARALDVAGRMSPPASPRRVAAIHQSRARVLLLLSRFIEAVAETTRMLDLARETGDRDAESEAIVEQAQVHWSTLSSEGMLEAKRLAEAAQALAVETGNVRVQARSLALLGSVQQTEGRLAEADRTFLESLRLAEAGRFADISVQPRLFLAAHAEWRGEFRRAVGLCVDAETAAAAIHDGFFEQMASAFACLAQIGLGQYADALGTITEGLRKARERSTPFFEARLTNTLGWLHQEFGDFRRAIELDADSATLGERIKNANAEISAAINLGLDFLMLDGPRKALPHLETCLTRVDKLGFGAHRWRWSIHIATYLAKALLADDQPGAALAQAERAMAQARDTGSTKYIGWSHLLRGDIAIAERQWSDAERECAEALTIGRSIAYPTLIWQAAHSLALARSARGDHEGAGEAARLAVATIDTVAAHAPDPALRRTVLEWDRVQAARDTLDRIRRG
jgi:class 3 adenylate cyclase/tetratricopeptide (TPR) repeat protein